MKIYGHHGFQRFILCLGYKGRLIKEYFLSYRSHVSDFTIRLSDKHEPTYLNKLGDEDWEITCAETGLYSGTGARLRIVRDYIDTPTFMFTYGDGIGSVDVTAVLDFHRAKGASARSPGFIPRRVTARCGSTAIGSWSSTRSRRPTWVS